MEEIEQEKEEIKEAVPMEKVYQPGNGERILVLILNDISNKLTKVIEHLEKKSDG